MLTRLLATSAIVLAMGGAAFAQTSSPTPSAAPSAQSTDSKATSEQATDKSGASASDDKSATGGSEVKSSASPPVSTGSDNKSTDVKTAPPAAGTSTTSGSTAASGSDKAAKDEPAPEKMDSSHVRASKWIGKGVEGADGKDIGKVADLILDKDGKVQKVILSVGGFLGIGDKHVALAPDQVKFGADDKLTTSMTQEQLKAHPRFEYAEDRSAPRSTSGSGSTVPPARPGGSAPSK